MIIKRVYATYGQLKKDKKSWSIIVRALCESSKKYSYDEAVQLLEMDSYVFVKNTDIESGIPADAYNNFMDKLNELDIKEPFDNGYTYRDVSGSVFYPSRKGNALMQILYCRKFESPIEIVQVIAFEKDGDTIKPIEPWDIGDICISE